MSPVGLQYPYDALCLIVLALSVIECVYGHALAEEFHPDGRLILGCGVTGFVIWIETLSTERMVASDLPCRETVLDACPNPVVVFLGFQGIGLIVLLGGLMHLILIKREASRPPATSSDAGTLG